MSLTITAKEGGIALERGRGTQLILFAALTYASSAVSRHLPTAPWGIEQCGRNQQECGQIRGIDSVFHTILRGLVCRCAGLAVEEVLVAQDAVEGHGDERGQQEELVLDLSHESVGGRL